MTTLETLSKQVTLSDDLEYRERALDERFIAVDIYSKTDIKFNLFFYVVDTETSDVFFGDYSLPDGVVIERILLGHEKALESVSI